MVLTIMRMPRFIRTSSAISETDHDAGNTHLCVAFAIGMMWTLLLSTISVLQGLLM